MQKHGEELNVGGLSVDRLTVALLERVGYVGQVQLLEDRIQFEIAVHDVQCRRRDWMPRQKRSPSALRLSNPLLRMVFTVRYFRLAHPDGALPRHAGVDLHRATCSDLSAAAQGR